MYATARISTHMKAEVDEAIRRQSRTQDSRTKPISYGPVVPDFGFLRILVRLSLLGALGLLRVESSCSGEMGGAAETLDHVAAR
jgi:hypothetical protein